MKRILLASVFAACTSIGLMSCMNGNYDANPTTTNSGGNPLNPPGGGGGGGNSFNWSGTAPLSMKVEGNSWTQASTLYVPAMGGLPAGVTAVDASNAMVIVSFPETTAPNTVVNFDATNFASYNTDQSNPTNQCLAHLGGGGAVQILENDASHVKGKFYFNGKNTSGTSVNITEGYFDVTK